jgi:hypothetical protein
MIRRILPQRGVRADARELREAAHDVKLGELLLARVGRHPDGIGDVEKGSFAVLTALLLLRRTRSV